jgi:hypothetical protein
MGNIYCQKRGKQIKNETKQKKIPRISVKLMDAPQIAANLRTTLRMICTMIIKRLVYI